jgi:hypothetical protein
VGGLITAVRESDKPACFERFSRSIAKLTVTFTRPCKTKTEPLLEIRRLMLRM